MIIVPSLRPKTVILALLFVCVFFSINTLTANAATYTPVNAPMYTLDNTTLWTQSGTWGTTTLTDVTLSRTFYSTNNGSAVFNPDIGTRSIGARMVVGTATGLVGINISLDNGNTWVLPSTVQGVTRNDGATGTALDSIYLHNSTTDFTTLIYDFPIEYADTCAIRYTRINGTLFIGYSQVVAYPLDQGIHLYNYWTTQQFTENNQSVTYYIGRTDFLTFAPNLHNATAIGVHYEIGSGYSGIIGVNISLDNGKTWVLPSTIQGLTRNDLATGTDLDVINATAYPGYSMVNDKIYFMPNSSCNPALRLTVVTNRIYISSGYAYTKDQIILCIGDSITAGGNSNTSYPKFLQTIYPDSLIFNYGINGDRITTGISSRYMSNLSVIRPGYVAIEGGINDIRNGVSAATIEGVLETMYTAAENNGTKVVAYTVTPNDDRPELVPVINDVNTWIKTQKVYVANANRALSDPASPGKYLPGYSDDGLHPNYYGYKIMADLFYESMHPPTANFSAGSFSGKNEQYQFMDVSSGSVDSWSWTFGDGSSSTEQNPVHVYEKPGDYTVTLTVTNSGGSSTTSQTITVNRVFQANDKVDKGAQNSFNLIMIIPLVIVGFFIVRMLSSGEVDWEAATKLAIAVAIIFIALMIVQAILAPFTSL